MRENLTEPFHKMEISKYSAILVSGDRGCGFPPLVRFRCRWSRAFRNEQLFLGALADIGMNLGYLNDDRLRASPQKSVTASSLFILWKPFLSSHTSSRVHGVGLLIDCAWHPCLYSCQNTVRITVTHLSCHLTMPVR